MIREVRKLFRQAKRLHKHAKRTGLPYHYAHFSDKRCEAKAAFRKASNTFYNNISDQLINPNTSQKSYWKLTKMVYGNKVSNGIHNIMCGDRLMDDSIEMAMRVLTPILQSSVACQRIQWLIRYRLLIIYELLFINS